MTAIRLSALAVASLLALSACRSTPEATPMPKPAATPAATAGVPAHDNLNATVWLQQSVEAHAVQRQTWRSAGRLLDAALADPGWDALAPQDRVAPLKDLPPAIIVDVDETVLDNSPYQAGLILDEQRFADPTWNAWVDEARAKAVAGAPEFAREAAERGITMIYLTNREHSKSAVTRANLEAVGFPAVAEAQFLGLGAPTPGCVSQGSDKGCRRQWVAQRYRVLMQFGDQLGDFVSIPENTPAARAALLRGFDAWVGQRWFALPNPTYGSWESAAYGNNRQVDAAGQREAKRAGLQR